MIGRPVDNTSLKSYRDCPKQYEYAYIQHRRGRGAPTPALAFGSGWHHAMQASYTAPKMPRSELVDRVQMYTAERWEKSSNPEDYRTFDRCMVEYENFLDRYGLPWEEEAQTVGWLNGAAMVEIATELPIPGARHPYTGKLDRIITEHGQYVIEDHKTASSMRSDYFKQWTMDNQMIGYAALASLVTGQQIAGVRVSLLVIRKSDSVFERQTIPFSPKRLQYWMANYDEWLGRMEQDYARRESGDPMAFPENYNACAGKYGMCQYAGVCSLDPARRQYALEQDFDVQEWNPLAGEDLIDA